MEFNLLPQIAGACGGSLYPETPPLCILFHAGYFGTISTSGCSCDKMDCVDTQADNQFEKENANREVAAGRDIIHE
jgi:hypothetical protein